ncbi:MAG TPA: DNRLRE domain-containing protein [candidate division Zixibacteria bacterium]|nr:DNRLRE domain-containing protein [candidate division Zixibacteria bacterium]
MSRISKILAASAVVGLLALGCSKNSPMSPSQTLSPGLTAQISIPTGAVLESATLHIFVNVANGQQIDVHRITSDWSETTVTWSNFGGAYDAGIDGSFSADSYGWHSVDITGLVQGWLDGTNANYGLLLDQALESYPLAVYYSREDATRPPYLEVCYSLNGTTSCVQDVDIADSYIRELDPNTNYGTEQYLYTGWINETSLEKQALLRFDIVSTPPPPPSGCTRTIGYWKTHAGFGPQADVVTPLLPIWLGTSGGTKSLQVTAAGMAVNVLNQHVYGSPSNGITKLYAQLLGAKLSIASGASDVDVSATVAAADAFLATHNFNDWSSLSRSEKAQVLSWQSTLDDYNNGLIGPMHCD